MILGDNTLLEWIVLIDVIVILRFVYLLIKRLILIRKINRKVKMRGGEIRYYRSPLTSIFKHDGKADLSISFSDKTIDVSIITTPLRRVRYHFDINNKRLELVVERRSMYVVNHKVPNGFSSMDRIYTVWKYKMHFETTNNEEQRYVILNPAPHSISKAEGATLVALGNNDTLINGVRVCGLKWFVENVIS